MKSFFKKCMIPFLLLVLTSLVSADMFVVSIDKDVNCKDYENNITICQENPAYDLLKRNVIPNIDTHYYDEVLDEVVKSKNTQIETLENKVTGHVTYNSQIENLYSSMEKVYIGGIILLSLLLINAYYQIYKLKKGR